MHVPVGNAGHNKPLNHSSGDHTALVSSLNYFHEPKVIDMIMRKPGKVTTNRTGLG